MQKPDAFMGSQGPSAFLQIMF